MAVLVVCGIVIGIYSFRPVGEDNSILVGAVFVGAADDLGWNQSHYEGIEKACEEHSCRLYSRMNVPEEEAALKQTVSELAGRGCSCIFLTSYGYGEYLDDIAGTYPKIAFYSISGNSKASNSMTYFARMYQARYLSGIVAGAATKTNVLGYVTAMPVPETIRCINAYAMGARRANPSARVLVKYTGSWDNREEEEKAVKELAAAGADVLTYHEDRPYAMDLADSMGLYTTGYGDVYKEYSERLLTSALTNWDALYANALSDYLRGRANFSKDYWMGLSDGAVSLYPCSELVEEDTKALVETEKQRIQTSRDVFSGEIRDNTGKLRCGMDERISDTELFEHMDWYVEGVEADEE